MRCDRILYLYLAFLSFCTCFHTVKFKLGSKIYSTLPFSNVEQQNELQVAANKLVSIGGYVVHKEYGIGKFIGRSLTRLSPLDHSSLSVPLVHIQYNDTNLKLFERYAKKDLWLYKLPGDTKVQLSSLMDRNNWERNKQVVENESRE